MVMKRVIKWLGASNRWKHLVSGAAVGVVGALIASASAGLYGAVAAGAAMEFKDRQWGGRPDVVDFLLTAVGGAAGLLI